MGRILYTKIIHFWLENTDKNIDDRAKSLKEFLETEFEQMYKTTNLSSAIKNLITEKINQRKEYDGFNLEYIRGGKTRRRRKSSASSGLMRTRT
jgi:hypothetical protein